MMEERPYRGRRRLERVSIRDPSGEKLRCGVVVVIAAVLLLLVVLVLVLVLMLVLVLVLVVVVVVEEEKSVVAAVVTYLPSTNSSYCSSDNVPAVNSPP